MATKTINIVLVLFVVSVKCTFAAFDKGGFSGIGARPIGMGGAFSTISDSGDAVFYNPAGLVQVLNPEISAMGAVLANGQEDLFEFAYVQPFSDQLAWALSTEQLIFTDNTENDRIYIGTFAAPLAIDKSISWGVNVKILATDSPTVPQAQGSGFGVDMGFLYHLPILDPRYGKQINIGLSAEDLDTQIKWQAGNTDPVALRVRGGFSYEFTSDLVAAFEFSNINDPNVGNNTILLAGIEGWFFEDHLGLRTGYSGFQTLNGQFTAGISYRSNSWGIDYAYIGHPQFLGSSHRISASWRFGESFLGKVKSFIPEGVNAYVEGGDIITLKWASSPSISLAGYNVYYSRTSGGGYVKVNATPIRANYFSARGLEKNTRYYFVVRSLTNTIPPTESQPSVEVIAGTTSAPSVPVVVQSEAQNEGYVDIARQAGMTTFQAPGSGQGGLRGYNIYVSEVEGGKFDKVNSVPLGNISSYPVRKLKVGQKYYFSFTSVGNDGSESIKSREITAIALPYNMATQNPPATGKTSP
jgi:hypothetical protein